MKKFELPNLPYSYDALAPFISAETLHLHHDKHHRAYVDKLNELLPGSGLEKLSLEEVIRNSTGTLYNQAGQHWNHSFFWNCMTPKKEAHTPFGKLEGAIKQAFGSVEKFKTEFETEAKEFFGSGWMWLMMDTDGPLQIMGTPDGDSPIYNHLVPLLCVDLWEHAYYVDYRNDRPSYLHDFWQVANWEFAEKNYHNFSRFHSAHKSSVKMAENSRSH